MIVAVGIGDCALAQGAENGDLLRGIDSYAEGVQAARLVAKILRGAQPEDLPVEGANKIELAINRKIVQAFGLKISAALMTRVDRVFEGIGE